MIMIGKELEDRRKALGLSLRKLAGIWNVSWNTIYRYEKDKIPIIHAGLIDLALKYMELQKQKEARKCKPKQLKSSKEAKRKSRQKS